MENGNFKALWSKITSMFGRAAVWLWVGSLVVCINALLGLVFSNPYLKFLISVPLAAAIYYAVYFSIVFMGILGIIIYILGCLFKKDLDILTPLFKWFVALAIIPPIIAIACTFGPLSHALAKITPLLSTSRTVRFIGTPLIILLSYGLFWLRLRHRIKYACLEIGVALYVTWDKLPPIEVKSFFQHPLNTSDNSALFVALVTGSIFLFIRGFDNFHQGYKDWKLLSVKQ